ncbi:tetratricopeptide repeat protein [Actinoplanes sp. NPDC004185]
MTSVVTPRHVHANVPIVSAADLRLTESPVAVGVSDPPIGRGPEKVRGRRKTVGEVQAVDGRVAVLTGPAGSGKSTVALAAARELAGSCSVHWVAAHHHGAFVEGMAAVAKALQVDDIDIMRVREEASTTAAWGLLDGRPGAGTGPGCALVIDNADDPALAAEIVGQATALVQTGWRVIVTTRVRPARPRARGGAVPIEVDALPVRDGADLLLDRIPEMDEARRRVELPHARTTAELLEGVPLVLHVAGSYLGSPLVRHSLAGYVTELGRAPALRPGLHPGDPAYALLPVLNLTLAAMGPEERRCALRLLGLLAAGAPGQPFPLGALLGTNEPLTERSLRLLRTTGVIEVFTSDNLPVAVVHPLIARTAEYVDGVRALPGRGAELLDAVTAALENGTAAYVEPGADAWPLWRLLLPHVNHLLDNPASGGTTAALRAAHRTVRHLLQRGMHHSAAELAVTAVERASGLTERDEPIRRTALLDHGLALQARALVTLPRPGVQNDLERAFHDINEVALRTRRACHPDDPEAMEAGHCLAAILHERGHLTESGRLFQQVFTARRRVLGDYHADTLATRQALASVLQAAGDAAEAQQMLDEVLADPDRHLDLTPAEVLSFRHSLAYARQAAGGSDWLQAAEDGFGDVLGARRAMLGATHPDTLITEHNVAWLDHARGHLARAEDGFRSVLAIQLRRLGKLHPHTVAVAANLAWVLLLRRRFTLSRRIFTQVLKVRTARLGILHPDTQTTRGNLGWLTYEEGHYHRAEHRFRTLYEDRVRLLGERHPRTLTTRHNLALSLRSQHQSPHNSPHVLHQAREVFIAVLDAQLQELAVDHDSTLATKYNLAVTLRMLNAPAWLDEAMTLLDQVLQALRDRPDQPNPLLRQTKREIVTLLAIRSGRVDVQDLVEDVPIEVGERPATVVDPLTESFVDDDIDDFPDPDLRSYSPPPSHN